MDLNKFEEGIKTTGFILENEISESLSEKRWSIINNKYYIDDLQKTVREIDIIAYKSSTIEGIVVYTSLIISCKKSEKEAWALLCKKANKQDPNIDWQPLFQWTNDPISTHFFNENDFKKNYLQDEDLNNSIFSVENHIFAFQQMSLTTGKAQNQNDIFSAITSLMKAQNYEIESLPKRKKSRCVYFFYLISIFHGKLILIRCDNNEIVASEIESENYLSNYIINGEQTSSRIHFMTKDNFIENIDTYKKLHEYNCNYISKSYSEFFSGALENYKQRQSALKLFWPKIRGNFRLNTRKALGKYNFEVEIGDIYIEKESDTLHVCLENISDEEIELMNNDSVLKKSTLQKIEGFFRIKVTGDIKFEDNIPF